MTYDGGFIAAAGYRSIRDDADLRLQASRHFDWDTHLHEETLGWQSCFISAFGDRRHAENWGRQRGGPVALYEIETQLLISSIVFDAVKLCDLLEIRDHSFAKNEFMFLDRIPGYCLSDQYQLVGRQYIRRPDWRATDVPRPSKLQRVPTAILGVSSRADSINFTGLATVLGFFGLEYLLPNSEACDGHGGLPMESANTEDDVEGLINSFRASLATLKSTCEMFRANFFRPVKSTNADDDVDSLVNSFDATLRLNNDNTPIPQNNTSKI